MKSHWQRVRKGGLATAAACQGWRVTSNGLIALMRPGALLQNIKPKRRSWILVSSRKERKEYCNVGVLQIIKARLLVLVFTNWVNCHTEGTACINQGTRPSFVFFAFFAINKKEGCCSTAIFRLKVYPVGELYAGILFMKRQKCA